MPEATQPKFACPSCGRQFTWKPELAGRGAKCKCGGTIKVPAQPPGAAVAPDEGNPLDSFEFNESAAPPAPAAKAKPQAPADAGMRCPSCGQSLAPGAVI